MANISVIGAPSPSSFIKPVSSNNCSRSLCFAPITTSSSFNSSIILFLLFFFDRLKIEAPPTILLPSCISLILFSFSFLIFSSNFVFISFCFFCIFSLSFSFSIISSSFKFTFLIASLTILSNNSSASFISFLSVSIISL